MEPSAKPNSEKVKYHMKQEKEKNKMDYSSIFSCGDIVCWNVYLGVIYFIANDK